MRDGYGACGDSGTLRDKFLAVLAKEAQAALSSLQPNSRAQSPTVNARNGSPADVSQAQSLERNTPPDSPGTLAVPPATWQTVESLMHALSGVGRHVSPQDETSITVLWRLCPVFLRLFPSCRPLWCSVTVLTGQLIHWLVVRPAALTGALQLTLSALKLSEEHPVFPMRTSSTDHVGAVTFLKLCRLVRPSITKQTFTNLAGPVLELEDGHGLVKGSRLLLLTGLMALLPKLSPPELSEQALGHLCLPSLKKLRALAASLASQQASHSPTPPKS
eukprot:g9853.t1